VFEALAASSFPTVVQESFEPGPTIATVRVRDGDRAAEVLLTTSTSLGVHTIELVG